MLQVRRPPRWMSGVQLPATAAIFLTRLRRRTYALWLVTDPLHLEGAHPSMHQCGSCGRQYQWRESLLRHQRVECGKEASLQCPVCPTRTKHKHSLQRHIQTHFTPRPPPPP